MLEALTGEDASLIASAGDLALVRALAGGTTALALANRSFTNLGVSPGTLTSTTSSKIVAAGLFTPKASGIFFACFNVNYSLSIADTVGFAVSSLVASPTVTVSGGVNAGITGSLVYETSGHAITTTGSGGGLGAAWDIVVPTPAIGLLSAPLSGPIALPLGVQSAITLTAQTISDATITFTSLTALIFELP